MDSDTGSTPSDSESPQRWILNLNFEYLVEAYIIQREEEVFMRGYEEAQSRCRLSMTCKSMIRPVPYPLQARIVELAGAFR